MVIALIVVLAAVVFLAIGRGGELSAERNDYAPLDVGPVSATDVALLRPPTGAWGYNMEATDDALDQIAESIRERDVRIVALEQLVTDLSRDHAPMPLLASPYAGARHRRAPGDTAEPGNTAEPEAVQAPRDIPATDPVQSTADPVWPATDAAWPTTDLAWPETDPARSTGEPVRPATEPARLPFEQPRPSGDVPPERSHD
jgi:hypothetical protein